MPKNPRVFISYSYDRKENPDHERWVSHLADVLANGEIDVVLDKWLVGPGSNLHRFMQDSIREADRVLMICTLPYVQKVNFGKGGSGYEGAIATAAIIDDQGTNKFIPIIRQPADTHVLPDCLSGPLICEPERSCDFNAGVEEIIREVHNKRLFSGANTSKDASASGQGSLRSSWPQLFLVVLLFGSTATAILVKWPRPTASDTVQDGSIAPTPRPWKRRQDVLSADAARDWHAAYDIRPSMKGIRQSLR
jgi:hypothetical protein